MSSHQSSDSSSSTDSSGSLHAIPIDDVRRWVSVRAAGVYRLLTVIEGMVADVEGAVLDEQYDYAAFVARQLAGHVLSIFNLKAGGAVDFNYAQLNVDYFEGVREATVDRLLSLAEGPLSMPDDVDPSKWLDDVRDLIRDTEALLELDARLPSLRSSEGMFPALALARQWYELCTSMNVPIGSIINF